MVGSKTGIRYVLFILSLCAPLSATTLDFGSHYHYGANIGWVHAGDPGSGLILGEFYCSGYLYAANLGWIHCGDGSPANGIDYGNSSSTDYGINHDGLGNLTGFAYGANIGWIVFEQNYGKPIINLLNGKLSGYAWSPNVGWISLDTLVTYYIHPGTDSDGDSIPDHWELDHAGNLADLGGGDFDGDGMSDYDEYEGDTDPFDQDDYTRIIDISGYNTFDVITWTTKPTRLYSLERSTGLAADSGWTPMGGPILGPTVPAIQMYVPKPADPKRFYHVKASLPLPAN